jgi:ribosomal protein S18 acetylase RimI-like enzyme
MSIAIRKAEREDIPAIYQLIMDLALYEKEPDAVIISAADLERHYLIEERFQCLVAVDGATIAGMALFYPRYSTWKGPTLHLEDFIVREDYRRGAIGKQLFTAFLKYAAAAKVQRVEWVVLNWNAPAIAFYEKQQAILDNQWAICQLSRTQILQNLKEEDESI